MTDYLLCCIVVLQIVTVAILYSYFEMARKIFRVGAVFFRDEIAPVLNEKIPTESQRKKDREVKHDATSEC